MQRDLSTFPLPPHTRFKLNSNGFSTSDDLKNIGPQELSKETQLTEEEAVEVLGLVFPASNTNDAKVEFFSVSALDMLLQEKSKPSVITFCQKLDDILGGGIPLRKVTEICGCPGVGKTQMCLQLCLSVQIPEVCGGLQGEAIYIDTEGSFIVERVVAIAGSTIDYCQKKVSEGKPMSSSAQNMESLTMKKTLESIHYFYCKTYTELLAVLNVLPDFLEQHPKVRLLVIDSISFHFRYGFDGSYSLRTRLLNGISQSLIRMASVFSLAVVLTNHMTTKIREQEANLVPALGESWGHACTIRLILFWKENQRYAMLFKSPWKQEAVVSYQITSSGIRDNLPLENSDDAGKKIPCVVLPQQPKRPRTDS